MLRSVLRGDHLGCIAAARRCSRRPRHRRGLVRETGRVLCRLDVPGAAGPEAEGEVVATISGRLRVWRRRVCSSQPTPRSPDAFIRTTLKPASECVSAVSYVDYEL